MKALFFGDSQARLYGVYQPPHRDRGPGGRQAVLLCYPGVQEYNLAHWAFRRLVHLLAQAGFPVFRFDYFGTGDSAGGLEQASLERWTQDIGTAAHEALDLSGCRSLSVVGMRLGAALAARACQTQLEVNNLVLWDPVVSGADYIAELKEREELMSLALLYGPTNGAEGSVLCGFDFPQTMQSSLRALDLVREGVPSKARQVTLVASSQKPHYRALQAAWSSQGCTVDFRGTAAAANQGSAQKQMLSNEALQLIVDHLSGKSDAQRTSP